MLPLKMFRQQNGLVDPMEVPLPIDLSWEMKFKTNIKSMIIFFDQKSWIKSNNYSDYWFFNVKYLRNNFKITKYHKKWQNITIICHYCTLSDIIWLLKRYSFHIQSDFPGLIWSDSGTKYKKNVKFFWIIFLME